MWRPDQDETPEYGAPQVKEKLERGEVRVLDVRELEEWDQAHIAGATWIPIGQLQRRYGELDPDAEWVCVCHLGSRSSSAADFLRYAGLNAANMIGGMHSWEARGFSTVSGRGEGGAG